MRGTQIKRLQWFIEDELGITKHDPQYKAIRKHLKKAYKRYKKGGSRWTHIPKSI